MKKSFSYYMRIWHRNLGYLTLGLVFVYALSGIVLIHRGDDFMKYHKRVEKSVSKGLDSKQLAEELGLWKMKVEAQDSSQIIFNEGRYDCLTGEVSYVETGWVFPIDRFAQLHMASCKQNAHLGWLTTVFGIILFFLSFSSLFMFKVSSPVFKKNMLYMVLGVVICVVLLLIS